MIILTPEEAAALRGQGAPGSRLEPVLLTDGLYALPEAVLDDAAYSDQHAVLGAMPRRAVDQSEFVAS